MHLEGRADLRAAYGVWRERSNRMRRGADPIPTDSKTGETAHCLKHAAPLDRETRL